MLALFNYFVFCSKILAYLSADSLLTIINDFLIFKENLFCFKLE